MRKTKGAKKDAGQLFIERLAAGCARARAGVNLGGEHIRMVPHRMPGLNRTVSTGTGSPVGGWPLGTTSIVHGANASGKSALLAATAASFQDANGVVYYVDAEFVLDLKWMWKLGVDPTRFALLGRHHEEVRNKVDAKMSDLYYEDVIQEVDRTIDEYRRARQSGVDIGPMLIVVDSLAKLIPRSISKKIDSSKGDLKKATLGMVQAGYNTTWCADLGPKIADYNIAVIFIQHEAEGEKEQWSGKTQSRIKGGRGILFDASVIAETSFSGRMYDSADSRAKGEEVARADPVSSKRLQVKIEKTKVGAQAYGKESTFEFFVSTGHGAAPLGFDRPRELLNEAARRGLFDLEEWTFKKKPALTLGTRVNGFAGVGGKIVTLGQMYERPELVTALEEVLDV